jgi:hypothetical protein
VGYLDQELSQAKTKKDLKLDLEKINYSSTNPKSAHFLEINKDPRSSHIPSS